MNNTSVEITAGLGGFLVVFALALAVWFLSRDLSKRLRRMRMTEQEQRGTISSQRTGVIPSTTTTPAAGAGTGTADDSVAEATDDTDDSGPRPRDPLA